MENKQKVSYLLLGVLIGFVVFVSFNSDSITSKAVESPQEIILLNCVKLSEGKVCDVQYPNGDVIKEGYKSYDGNT